MIPRDQLPEDAVDWTHYPMSFPYLPNNTIASCPISENEVFKYVCMESADTDTSRRDRLQFIRTARVANAAYWLWEYTEEDGERCFVMFRQNPDGSSLLSLSEPNGLSHEQYLLANYYDEIYWS